MPNTYTLISSTTLTTTTAFVNFSAIPSTFTDLTLRYAFRDADASSIGALFLTFNGNTSSVYSRTRLRADNSSPRVVESSRIANATTIAILGAANSATANTFSSNEIYIPNYASAANKTFSTFDVTSTNSATQADQSLLAGLFRSTTAISSIKLEGSTNLIAGSSFYLYGISKS
jgi:hypothetical protein